MVGGHVVKSIDIYVAIENNCAAVDLKKKNDFHDFLFFCNYVNFDVYVIIIIIIK